MRKPRRLGVSRLLIPLCLFAVCLLSAGSSWGASVPRHIHLSWENDPASSVTVTWRTDQGAASFVEYGPTETLGSKASGLPAEIHQVRLEGLLPSTRYFYRCGDGVSWSEIFHFETGPGDVSGQFCFAVYGDDRGGFDVRRSIGLAILGRTDAEFVINTGDLVSNGNEQPLWDLWFESLRELLSVRVLMPAIGNHEENSPLYFEQFALPGREAWYSFDYGNAHFVVLSTETALTGEQLEWLEDDLSRCNSTWRFAIFHRPMYSSGYHGSDLSVRRAWEETLVRHGVDLAFCGHNHIYERTRPVGPEEGGHGIVHIITGGGGAGLHELGAVIESYTEIAVSEHHYVLVNIKGGSLVLESRLPDGTVFDRVEVMKEPLPDLVVERVGLEPDFPAPGLGANITAIVKNRGQAFAGESLVHFSVNGETCAEIPLESLDPGEIVLARAEWLPQEDGPVNVEVTVDPTGLVEEGLNEDNNQLSRRTIVSEPAPDLQVISITCAPAPPRPMDPTNITIAVGNGGNADSGPFDIEVWIGEDGLHHTASIQGLAPGEVAEREVAWVARKGDWRLFIVADPGGVVEEMVEGNNAGNQTIYVRDFVRDGPAYLPKAIDSLLPSVVYYNASESVLGDSPTICVLWGIDGWQRPTVGLAGPRTLALSRAFQTRMERFGTGLWVGLLPSSPDIQTIDLRFIDRPVVPELVDDNLGRDWVILGEPWAEARLAELSGAIIEAAAAGVDVSDELKVEEEARACLVAGDYYGLNATIGGRIDELRRQECSSIIGRAELEYQRAVDEQLDVGRVRIYLDAASGELERGNLHQAKVLALNALDLIDDARGEVPEPIRAAALAVLVGLLLLRDRRARPGGPDFLRMASDTGSPVHQAPFSHSRSKTAHLMPSYGRSSPPS